MKGMYQQISKPFILGTGTAVEINGKLREFPTENEAMEFIEEIKKEVAV